ncbi:hypothetical protein QT327_03750 [Olivibacter sp. 47]|uniref:hypothetical protein n=1 Tax=Olivibacter sp. 47 TaxID=3056486 RepID=UPI0025A34B7E|nr:hypothetical protein [Olivibacter sp. 47]MDM8173480.1 hypothetical protein [Olivibacter sp. 47]
MEKKKLDDLFREGLNNPEVSYDEMHWIAMEEKLVNNRKKKVRLIWLSSLSAAAAVILVFLVIWWPITSDQSVEVVKKEDSIISKKTHIDKPVPPIVDQIVKMIRRHRRIRHQRFPSLFLKTNLTNERVDWKLYRKTYIKIP